jgi:hypothetical protein
MIRTSAFSARTEFSVTTAEFELLSPEKAKSTRTPKRVLHVICFAFLEVGLAGRVVRIRFAFDLNVSFDGCATGAVQPELARLSLVVTCFTEERPIASPALPKVSLLEPVRGLLRVPSPCPLPYTTEDDGVNVYKSMLTHHVPMIVGPTPNLWVEFTNQVGGRPANRGLDYSSDAIQEGLNILLGRLDEQFPIRISAHVLSDARLMRCYPVSTRINSVTSPWRSPLVSNSISGIWPIGNRHDGRAQQSRQFFKRPTGTNAN